MENRRQRTRSGQPLARKPPPAPVDTQEYEVLEYYDRTGRLIDSETRPVPAEEADTSYAGHYAGWHPEHRPCTTAEMQRATAHQRQSAPAQEAQKTRVLPVAPATRRLSQRHWHPLALISLACLVMLLGWLALSALRSWWQTQQDTWRYGMPRTYQTDCYVGHEDSPTHPNHFIAINLNDAVEVMEINVLHLAASHLYPVTTIADPTTPVTLSFRDVNHDGKVDMLVSIGDSNPYTIIFLNNGTAFVESQ